MVQFCIAYCGILAQHTVCATDVTGRLVTEATGLPIHRYLSHTHGGVQQIGARIDLNEIDMVLFFKDPGSDALTGRRQLHRLPVRRQQYPLRQQYRHGGGPDPGPEMRRSGLAQHRQPRNWPRNKVKETGISRKKPGKIVTFSSALH